MNAPAIEFREADHSYWYGTRRVPSVTQLLAPLYDWSMVDPAVLSAKAALGTAVHFACELIDRDDLDESTLDEPLVPYVAAYRRFLDEHEFKPELIEERVFHPTLVYAGTLDRYGELDGSAAIIDLKTSATLHPAMGVQTAAYLEALRAQRTSIPKRAKRYALQLRPDATYTLKPYSDARDWGVFQALVSLHHWKAEHKL